MSAFRFLRRRWRLGALLSLVVALGFASVAAADDWPQWLGPQRDGVWREEGIRDRFPAGGPKVRWRVPTGSGYSGPAVADGHVYLTDFVTKGGAKLPGGGMGRSRLAGVERVLCLDDA